MQKVIDCAQLLVDADEACDKTQKIHAMSELRKALHDLSNLSDEEKKQAYWRAQIEESIARGECQSCGYKPCLCDQQ